ncbi:MAG: acyclic terpene utilization AtuA family protein [Oligoflexales bacterium]
METLRIGNAGGFWGDDPDALRRQVEQGQLDYITMDFLAEVTMSIMQKQRSRDPSLGYAKDFIPMIENVLPTLLRKKTRIITNAGGINPTACAQAVSDVAKRLGLTPKIAIVSGDDILTHLPQLQKKGASFTNMETGQELSEVSKPFDAANIYFGARSVAECLTWNPDIVITGRVTDTGITLAPMIHHFNWSWTDWNKLASGIVAGHILECGSQSTGGNFTDWEQVESFSDIGFPIAEVSQDGTFVITKHKNTGGQVTIDTVREQIVYEMGQPHAYITPDVVVDFSSIRLQEDGLNRVRVTSVQGQEPTPFYKVSMAYQDGFKTTGSLAICGPHARKKADAFAKIFWKKAKNLGEFQDELTEFYGHNACHRSLGHAKDGEEIILRLSARSPSKEVLHKFGKLIPSLLLAGPPGVCVLGGVPRPQEVVHYWPALLPKEWVHPVISLWEHQLEETRTITAHSLGHQTPHDKNAQKADKPQKAIHQNGSPLSSICLARSGDKGDMANIGVLARSPEAYEYLKKELTAQKVLDWFQDLCKGSVTRFELDNIDGFNFLLDSSLGGGGSCSLRVDPQGKMFAQALLRQHLSIPQEVLDACSKK